MGTKPESVVIQWNDEGKQTTYSSATEFLLRTAAKQWSGTSHEEMKIQLSKRALTMTGKFIHPYQPDEPFVRELGRCGFIKVAFRRAS